MDVSVFKKLPLNQTVILEVQKEEKQRLTRLMIQSSFQNFLSFLKMA